MRQHRFAPYISLAAGLALLTALVLYITFVAYRQNDDHLVYPLDDTYIHMSMAKNFAQHGVWGVTSYAFSSTSSSLLYTALLAFCYLVFGLSELTPFVLNFLFGLAVVYALWRIGQKEGLSPLYNFFVQAAAVLCTPLPQLIISGMEHTLQLLIDLLFVYMGVKLVVQSGPLAKRRVGFLMLLALLAVTVRFEGLFLVAALGLFFLARKRFSLVLLLGITAALPLLLYGLISISKGAYFFPNSVVLKGEQVHLNAKGLYVLATVWVSRLFLSPELLVLFFVLGFAFLYQRLMRKSFWTQATVWPLVLMMVLIVHITFARTGWFERYEAYLVFLSIASLMFPLSGAGFRWQWRRQAVTYAAVCALGILIAYPLFYRFKRSYKLGAAAMANVYHQQYQMARFLHRYYNDSAIAANDIGAITYFTNIRLFDMVGLASNEPLRLKRANAYTKEAIEKLAAEKGVTTVLIFEDWYRGKIPGSWKKTGTWTEPHNCWTNDSVTVSFFATPLQNPDRLKSNLRSFSSQVPRHVVQGGAYTNLSDSAGLTKIW